MSGLLFGFFLIASTAFANVQCTSYPSQHLQRDVRYCIQRSHPQLEQINGERVAYYFHGLMGNAANWAERKYDENLKALAKDEHFEPITFVSFDTHEESFFSDFEGKPTGGRSYESWFIKEFLPYIETKYRVCNERECRGAVGLSMGGFGAMKTVLKHPEKFSTVAVNCPALPPFSLHEPISLWREYFLRHPVGNLIGQALLRRTRAIFPTELLYQENDPASLVTNFQDRALFPDMYFDVGDEDYFGFQEGAERLRTALDDQKFPYSFHLESHMGHAIHEKTGKDILRFVMQRLGF
jgi:S-formylglutathione hydrolase FrmB